MTEATVARMVKYKIRSAFYISPVPYVARFLCLMQFFMYNMSLVKYLTDFQTRKGDERGGALGCCLFYLSPF